MITNSELPLTMLKENNELNQYDFVLFHLYQSNAKYREYYQKQRINHPDRLMIFDNSAYEFFVKGEELNLHEYYEAVCELKPDMYILPDVLMNKEKTLEGVAQFLELYTLGIGLNTGKSQPLAVAQGMTENDLLDCLKQYKSLNIKNVAIPFHNSFFKDKGERVAGEVEEAFLVAYGWPLTPDHLYAMGRVQFMRDHKDELKEFDWIHILGSHCPLEKIFYSDWDSMDTGYPVKCAIAGVKLGWEIEKPNIIIDEFLNKRLDKQTKTLIRENVQKFRDM